MQASKLFISRAFQALNCSLNRTTAQCYFKGLGYNSMTKPRIVQTSGVLPNRGFSSWKGTAQSEDSSRTRQFMKTLGGIVGVGVAGSLLALALRDLPTCHMEEAKGKDDDRGGNDDVSSARWKWNFIADTVERAAPAVVYIEIQGRHPFTGQKMPVSNGSGFIVRSDGLILTNAHVVANKSSVVVRLQDGSTLTGRVEAVDPISDLATVRVSAKNLPTLKLGKSGQLRAGEWVVAMGSPFQLSNTVTAGIVSSAGRGGKELGLHNKDINYIQTDANINFGNSGGPLVNLDGEAIGINTMMVTTGISFAIPSDYAAKFLQRAESIEKRSESKGWFGTTSKLTPVRRYVGITMLTLMPDIIKSLKARHFDFPDVDHGVLVHRVVTGSPAHSAGMQPGDIITKINDSDIVSSADIYSIISSSQQLLVTVHRGTDKLLINIVPENVE